MLYWIFREKYGVAFYYSIVFVRLFGTFKGNVSSGNSVGQLLQLFLLFSNRWLWIVLVPSQWFSALAVHLNHLGSFYKTPEHLNQNGGGQVQASAPLNTPKAHSGESHRGFVWQGLCHLPWWATLRVKLSSLCSVGCVDGEIQHFGERRGRYKYLEDAVNKIWVNVKI